MSRLTRDGTAEPVSRDQILRRERGQGNIHFTCSADHEQDWQPYPVDPYSCYMCDHIYTVLRPYNLFAIIPLSESIHRRILLIATNSVSINSIIAASPSSSRSTPVAQLAPRNLLTRWDVSSIPANGIFLTKH